jgi:NADPH-dependent ferric siderophore reductase
MTSALKCSCQLNLPQHATYMPQVRDRLESFRAKVELGVGTEFRLSWPFGWLSISSCDDRFTLKGGAPDAAGLARIKDLLATAFKLYAKVDAPEIVWTGDHADDQRLAPFRLMEVGNVSDLGTQMKRVRLHGTDLSRFEEFGNMHVRLLLPSIDVPDPIWPVAGPDGLTVWPDPERKAASRVYTIRAIDTAASWVDIDVVTHGTTGPGSAWALSAKAGDQIGMFGPLGRPINRKAQHYIIGADETGLPALARMLEILPETATGVACIEVANEADIQPINNRTQVEVEWLFRRDAPAGTSMALSDRVMAEHWRNDLDCFGWFAAEDVAARRLRNHWRQDLGLGRDQTLAAAYWKRGTKGLMAG